jgi:quercetin dioxygenase-like cupin family protein
MKLPRCVCGVVAALFLLVGSAPAEPAAYSAAVTVTPLLKTQADGTGRPLVYPADGPAEVTVVHVEIAPGQQTNWHQHPVPCFAYMLEGEVHVELATGETKVFKAGQAFAEVVDLLHNGRNPGPKPAKLVMFVLATAGRPYAVKAPAPAR